VHVDVEYRDFHGGSTKQDPPYRYAVGSFQL
jgi:hypothetical protein